MKKKQLVILLLFVSTHIFGQENTNKAKQIDLKLYTNFSFIHRYTELGKDTLNGTTRLEHTKDFYGFSFSPAFVFYNKKGNSSEIEISRLNYTNNYIKEYTQLDSTGAIMHVISGHTKKEFDFHFRYEYQLRLFKKKDWKRINLSIGFSATPFVEWNKTEPTLSTEFVSSKTIIGVYLSVIPRIEYTINEKWYLDLNIPIAVANAYYTSIKDEDPSIPSEESNVNSFNFYNAPRDLTIRFGLGFRL